MIESYLTSFLVLAGMFFVFAGSVGLVRMPDVFCRMHAATKTTTLGLGFILIASFVRLGINDVGIKPFLAVAFAFLTAPVSAHLISRAAYKRGVKLCKDTVIDELSPLYKDDREKLNRDED